MSFGEHLDLEGRVSRRCESCGITITVTRPPRPLSSTTGQKARRHLGAELKRQILWDAMCPVCIEAWNALIKRCERGLSERREA